MSPAAIEMARKANLTVVDAKTKKQAKIIAVYPQKNSCQLYFSQELGGDGRFETIACNRIAGIKMGDWRTDDLRFTWTKALFAMRQARRRMEQMGIQRVSAAQSSPNNVLRSDLYEYLAVAEELVKEAKAMELKDPTVWSSK